MKTQDITGKQEQASINPRSMPQFHEGRSAYLDNLPARGVLSNEEADDLCPYPLLIQHYNAKRWAWWCGWYETHVEVRLGHLFGRLGLEWP